MDASWQQGVGGTSRKRAAALRGIFWLATGCALMLVVLAPIARSRGWWWAVPIYQAFGRLCHQMPERSFHLEGHPLAVCHRCSGIYLGFWLGLLAWGRSRRWRPFLLANPRLLLLGFVPAAADFLLLAWNTPASRLSTGLAAGLTLALLARAGLDELAPHLALKMETSHVG